MIVHYEVWVCEKLRRKELYILDCHIEKNLHRHFEWIIQKVEDLMNMYISCSFFSPHNERKKSGVMEREWSQNVHYFQHFFRTGIQCSYQQNFRTSETVEKILQVKSYNSCQQLWHDFDKVKISSELDPVSCVTLWSLEISST